MNTELAQFVVTYFEANDSEVHWHFECMAEDSDHAREQCLNAEPDATIINVEWIDNN